MVILEKFVRSALYTPPAVALPDEYLYVVEDPLPLAPRLAVALSGSFASGGAALARQHSQSDAPRRQPSRRQGEPIADLAESGFGRQRRRVDRGAHEGYRAA